MGIVGLSGLRGLSGVFAGISPATYGMTLDATWTTGSLYSDLVNANAFSGAINVTITPSSTGFIIEAGGSVVGLGVYCYAGSLYFQSGVASTSRQLGVDMLEASWSIPMGENNVLIEFSGSGILNKAALYINGCLVDIATKTTAGKLVGTNEGGVGERKGDQPGTRMAGIISPPFTFTGTLNSDLSLYVDEVTADVSS